MPRWRNAQRIFGKERHAIKPRNQEEWDRLFNKHKYILPSSVSSVHVKWSKKGAGQTGARLFNVQYVTPMRHWNSNVKFSHERMQEPGEPTILMGVNGAEKQMNVRGKRVEEIYEEMLETIHK